MSEENKREAGRQEETAAAEQQSPPAAEQTEPAAAEQREPANTQEVSGTEPAGAGAEHPNQPQPDTMPEHPDASASDKPAEPAEPAAPAAANADAPSAPAGEAAGAGAVDPEREAKIKAAQEARAKRLAAKAAAGGEAAPGDAEPAEPKPPSPKQPWLDEAVELLKSEVHPEAVEEAVINELAGDMPTITVKAEHWRAAAELLKSHEKLGCNYLRNVTGVDYEAHMEVVYFVINLETKREYAIKIRTDREQPSVPSAVPVWPSADWPEREIYDLLGVDFPGHPDLRRIMMPDDWVGHPLRKDYVPLDPEV
ncbi:NADH/F420H2 dehydrogenase, subunit C [Thermobacillus composti KWC4]|uniref:NADH-quinone oxidoreductase subunit C n=1 Tax=Thermobacillus composti (strain DSM 18247 / JCM 13945 / KWC4) TaxID=717605 RepID=L0EKS4_THECK|nr:NADH-quinone oxidoreductase subunit C [Thermobacillus composti]AGA59865.1 NADH/F420H2 dehydrogenase, subunit C [Thermobacillus composti KWC4]